MLYHFIIGYKVLISKVEPSPGYTGGKGSIPGRRTRFSSNRRFQKAWADLMVVGAVIQQFNCH